MRIAEEGSQIITDADVEQSLHCMIWKGYMFIANAGAVLYTGPM